MKYLLLLLILLVPFSSFAHSGKLNTDGCHNNKKTGQYECHAMIAKGAKQNSKTVAKKVAKVSTKLDYNCADFVTQEAAQKAFIKAGGPKFDSYDLDRDKDGLACEK